MLIGSSFFQTAWTKFVKKNFLVENDISFFEILSGADFIWSIEVLSRSERFLRIPVACYFWREDSLESVTRIKRPVAKQILFWTIAFTSWTRTIKKLSDKVEVLKQNPVYCYAAIMSRFNFCLSRNIEARFKVSPNEIYEILQRELENQDSTDLMVPFFLSIVDSLQKDLIITQQQQNQLPEEVKTHIADLEKSNKYIKAYVAELEKFVADSQQYIAELEAELAQLKGKA